MGQQRKVKVYVAASWNNKAQVRVVSKQLVAAGFNVVSDWVDQADETTPESAAASDLAALRECDVCLLLTDMQSSSGAMHFEAGWAYAMRDLAVVGPVLRYEKGKPTTYCNPFYHMNTVSQFGSVEEFINEYSGTERSSEQSN